MEYPPETIALCLDFRQSMPSFFFLLYLGLVEVNADGAEKEDKEEEEKED